MRPPLPTSTGDPVVDGWIREWAADRAELERLRAEGMLCTVTTMGIIAEREALRAEVARLHAIDDGPYVAVKEAETRAEAITAVARAMLPLLTAAQWGSCDGCRTVSPDDAEDRKFTCCIFCAEPHQEGDWDSDAYRVTTRPHAADCPLVPVLARAREALG